MPLVSREEILKLIPQRPPIVMVHTLEAYTESNTQTTFNVEPDNLFVADGKMSAYGLVENIAQTAAAGAGYYYMTNNEPAPIGFIGAVSKLKVHQLPEVGASIRTTVELISQFGPLSLVKARNELDGALLAECEMKIVIDENAAAQ